MRTSLHPRSPAGFARFRVAPTADSAGETGKTSSFTTRQEGLHNDKMKRWPFLNCHRMLEGGAGAYRSIRNV
jgi:hypothetical protein